MMMGVAGQKNKLGVQGERKMFLIKLNSLVRWWNVGDQLKLRVIYNYQQQTIIKLSYYINNHIDWMCLFLRYYYISLNVINDNLLIYLDWFERF